MSASESPAPATPQNPVERLAARAESVLKVLSLSGIILYGLGLSSQIHFCQKYGTTDFAILKPQVVHWHLTLAVLLLAALPGFSAITKIADKKGTLYLGCFGRSFLFIPVCYEWSTCRGHIYRFSRRSRFAKGKTL